MLPKVTPSRKGAWLQCSNDVINVVFLDPCGMYARLGRKNTFPGRKARVA